MYIHVHAFKIILCSLNRCKLHFDICKQHHLRLDLHSSHIGGPGGSMSYVVGSNNSYKPITNTAWVRAQLCKLQKRCTRLAAASDKVYLLLTQQVRIQDFKLGGRTEGGANILGVFRVKNHDFTPKKIIFFPILGGARAGCAPPPPPLDPPLPRVGGSLRVLRLPPPLKLFAKI
jgi:hypothetical protein